MSGFRERYQPRATEIIDTTLRDGSGAAELREVGLEFFHTADKVQIVEGLIKYGVRFIEVYSPSVSPQDAYDFQAILETRNRLVKEGYSYTYILAHVMCKKDQIDAALKAGADGLNLFMGTSPESIESKHGQSLEQIGKITADIAKNVRSDHPNKRIRFSGEDAFNTKGDDLLIPYRAVADYIDCFGTPDTNGMAKPGQVRRRIRALRKEFPEHDIEGHFHHDDARSLENALAAAGAGGIIYMNTSILGLGERSGITDMSDYIFRRYKDRQKNVDGYDIGLTYSLNVLIADILKIRVPYRLIVSATNRTHSAGVHVAAMLKDPKTYERNEKHLKKFGVTQRKLLLGTLSGWHAVDYCLKEFLDYDPNIVTEAVARDICAEFKSTVHGCLIANPNLKPKDILDQIAFSRGIPKIIKPDTQRETIME